MSVFPVRLSFPVHWGEMDALGHVNNTRYFVWFESARMALFQRAGIVSEGEPEVGPILAHTRCDFRKPVRYPAVVEVETRIASLGRTSFVMEYRVLQGMDPEPGSGVGPVGVGKGSAAGTRSVVAEGSGVVVLINYKNGEKVAIPPPLRARLEALSGTDAKTGGDGAGDDGAGGDGF